MTVPDPQKEGRRAKPLYRPFSECLKGGIAGFMLKIKNKKEV